jgi:hypothetical protein
MHQECCIANFGRSKALGDPAEGVVLKFGVDNLLAERTELNEIEIAVIKRYPTV